MKKYELTTVQDKDVVIDISQLFREEVLYINATKLANQFEKRLDHYWNSLETKEYYDVLNTRNNGELELVKTSKGKYGGTYIHSFAIVHFLRYLSIEFAVDCDLYLRSKIQEAHDEKTRIVATLEANKANDGWVTIREDGKETRKSLTDTIENFCRYAEDGREEPYENNKCPYYVLLTELVYDALGINRPEGKTPLRDVFAKPIVKEIERLEGILIELIEEVIFDEVEYHKAFKHIKKHINEVGHSV